MNRTLSLVLALAMVTTLAIVPGAAAADTTTDAPAEPTAIVTFDDGDLTGPTILEIGGPDPGNPNCISASNCVGTGG